MFGVFVGLFFSALGRAASVFENKEEWELRRIYFGRHETGPDYRYRYLVYKNGVLDRIEMSYKSPGPEELGLADQKPAIAIDKEILSYR
jgi:hypothetical protein